jgi:2-amino-4-hydroxy-6-hydroxymethyldihydropteridine diphosphokinase
VSERVFVGLGANLGDMAGHAGSAVDSAGGLPTHAVVAESPRYRSAPLQASGPDFLNCVVELATDLEPASSCWPPCTRIEAAHGRERPFRERATHAGPRPAALRQQRCLHTETLAPAAPAPARTSLRAGPPAGHCPRHRASVLGSLRAQYLLVAGSDRALT